MKINLTGFTRQQQTGKSRKGVIGLNTLLPEMLEDLGHEVERDIEGADINIVSVIDLGSINAANATNCFKLLKKKNTIIAFDDWNIKGFYGTIDKIIERNAFSKTHHSVNWKEVMANLDVIMKLKNGEIPSIYPAYKTGDHNLLQIRGKKFCLDPSIYVDKESFTPSGNCDLMVVHASLATKWRDLDKKKYSILNVRNEKESDVFDYYCKHRIVLSPPHYHDGSGWWRNRYDLANRARAVVIEDEKSPFGETYTISRKEVNDSNIEEVFALQDESYHATIMSKEEIKKTVESVISEISQ